MKVTLISYPTVPEKAVVAGAKMCYSNTPNIESLLNGKNNEEYIEKLIESGHLSPFEHSSFTFCIEGISRACSHQLVRHRMASFSQRSQRYCSETKAEYVTPPNLTPEQKEIYNSFMSQCLTAYNELVKLGVKKEDARYVLPNATETRLIMTMNVRELRHFFNLRCCTRAQWEIRGLANEMLRQCEIVAPSLFVNAGASCTELGYCPEGSMCCGKAPTLEVLACK